VKVPSVHLNGSGREELMRQLSNAHTALEKGLNVLCKAAPHGRDYYVQDDPYVGPYGPAYKEAREEFDSRVQRVASVVTELYDMMEELSKS
jgi:hypothetical protein